jgi:hypothetical protein
MGRQDAKGIVLAQQACRESIGIYRVRQPLRLDLVDKIHRAVNLSTGDGS